MRISPPISSPLFYCAVWPLLILAAVPLARLSGVGAAQARREGHYAGIEGLRGILALNVLFHHSLITYFFLRTGVWDITPSLSRFYANLGPGSVAMFFFITGFLFWSKVMVAPSFSIAGFLRARGRRLMPAYLGAFAAVAVITAWKTHFALVVSLRDLLLEGFSWALCGLPDGFPRINGFPSVQINAQVFWTLGVEWTFYLLLPFLAWFAHKKRLPWLFLLSGALIAGVNAVWHARMQLVYILGSPEHWSYSIESFCIGIVAAHLKEERKQWPALRHPACSVLGALLFFGVLLLSPFKLGLLSLSLLGVVFLMVLYGNDFHGLLTCRPILYLGTISYSIYLLHGIVLYLAVQELNPYLHVATFSPLQYWAYIGGVGVVVILLASLSYRLLEKPFFRKPWLRETPQPGLAISREVVEPAL
ncbi:MAG: acyltransferase family protein [Acidobacteriota bacterium]